MTLLNPVNKARDLYCELWRDVFTESFVLPVY